MNRLGNTRIHTALLVGAAEINAAVCESFERQVHDAATRRSHLFGGRYENIYISLERIPEVQAVLDAAEHHARGILGHAAPQCLKSGFWFNCMAPGEATLPHSHDDWDELLSAVYYLSVPPESGQLIIQDGDTPAVVEPRAGMFVFFPADRVHEVTPNRSHTQRLSLAMNFGPHE